MTQFLTDSVSRSNVSRPDELRIEQAINAINQMFAEFELVYHNQYQKAFSTKEKEDWAKKLWFSNLKDFTAEEILNAAHKAIKTSSFLPTVHDVLKHCEKQGFILPLLIEAEAPASMSKTSKQAALDKLRRETGI